MQIKAAIARQAHQPFSIERASIEAPRSDEVLVEIHGVGLCHTDLIARDQFIPIRLPAVLGHEGAGIVTAVGKDVRKVRAGDRVVLSFSSCGECARCQENLPSYCRHFPALNYSGTRSDGSRGIRIASEEISANFFGQSSFASHALTHERNVVKIEDADIPLAILGPLGCGLQTGAGGVMRSLACPAGSSIAIFGGGPYTSLKQRNAQCSEVFGTHLMDRSHLLVVRGPAQNLESLVPSTSRRVGVDRNGRSGYAGHFGDLCPELLKVRPARGPRRESIIM